MGKCTIDKVDVQGKRVYVRVDYNVPFDDTGRISDETRIRATLPTLNDLLDRGAALVLAAHLGRPKGKRVEKYSLAPVATCLAALLNRTVQFVDDCIGDRVKEKVATLQSGDVLLLENVRFYEEEEKNDPAFAKQLASWGEVAVNDAFGVSHRAHASVVGVANYVPMVAGRLLEAEIRFLEGAVTSPKRPFVAIIGGAKVSDKIGVIDRLVELADTVIIGGGMANTFFLAQGYEVGTSLVERDKVDIAAAVLAKAKSLGKQLLLPIDVVTADRFAADATPYTVAVDAIGNDQMVLDIGPESANLFSAVIKEAKTVVWNGPMGVFEMAAFAHGTEALARAVAESDAISIVGGGDSVAAIEQCGLADRISHISTGGGASLEYLEGKVLPGIACLVEEEL